MVKNKWVDRIFWTVVIAGVLGLSYPLFKNITDQVDINAVFDEASLAVRDTCTSKANYSKLVSFFDKEMRDTYHKCIVDSRDEQFKAAAAKYILERMSKHGETDALKELKAAIDS